MSLANNDLSNSKSQPYSADKRKSQIKAKRQDKAWERVTKGETPELKAYQKVVDHYDDMYDDLNRNPGSSKWAHQAGLDIRRHWGDLARATLRDAVTKEQDRIGSKVATDELRKTKLHDDVIKLVTSYLS